MPPGKKCDFTEYQVGNNFKDHLIQDFLAKTLFRQDDSAPCPVES